MFQTIISYFAVVLFFCILRGMYVLKIVSDFRYAKEIKIFEFSHS